MRITVAGTVIDMARITVIAIVNGMMIITVQGTVGDMVRITVRDTLKGMYCGYVYNYS